MARLPKVDLQLQVGTVVGVLWEKKSTAHRLLTLGLMFANNPEVSTFLLLFVVRRLGVDF